MRVVRILLIAAFVVVVAPAVVASADTSHNPIGHVDELVYDAKYRDVLTLGWAGDFDSGAAPVEVVIVVDGHTIGQVSTGGSRPDVQRVYPALGPNTGFGAVPDAPPGRGPHRGCVTVVNRGPGHDVSLGCRTIRVTEPGALVGHIDSIAVDPANSQRRIITGWVLDPYDALSPTPFDIQRTAGPSNGIGVYVQTSRMEADQPRPDVDRVYPNNGHRHGFVTKVPLGRRYGVDWAAGATICISIDISNGFPGDEGIPTQFCATSPG